MYFEIENLKGCVFSKVNLANSRYDPEHSNEMVIFYINNLPVYGIAYPNAGEYMQLEGVDITGNLSDLENSPILFAEERWEEEFEGTTHNTGRDDGYGDVEWVFYELATIKGSVTLLFQGSRDSYGYGLPATFGHVEKSRLGLDIIPHSTYLYRKDQEIERIKKRKGSGKGAC